MNVYILTEGGKAVGLGHIIRCLSIFQAFKKRDIVPKMVVHGDDTIKSILPIKKYFQFNWLENIEKALTLIKNPDIIIIDSYIASKEVYKKLSSVGRLCIYFDDFNRLNYPTGVVINPSLNAPEIKYLQMDGKRYLLGPHYIPLREEFWNTNEKVINEKISNIFVSLGGDDIRNLTPTILKLLTKYYSNPTKTVVISREFKNKKEIEQVKDIHTHLLYYPNSSEMKKAMLSADIAIAPNGQTLYELARIGIPTIAIAVTDRQIKSLKCWNKKGFIEYIGKYSELNIRENILNSIDLLKEKKIRMQKSKIGKTLVDGKGAVRIIDFLLKYFQKSQ